MVLTRIHHQHGRDGRLALDRDRRRHLGWRHRHVGAFRWAAVVVAAGLLASACGAFGSDGSEPDGADSVGGPSVTDGSFEGAGAAAARGDEVSGAGDGSGAADGDGPTGAAAPTSITELEAHWAQRRADVVERIRSGGYGVDSEGVLVGPGGFQVDLGACPDGWSDTGGIGETIAIGYTTARTGNNAPFGYVADGMAAYFDYVNATGGVAGRPLELVIQDDEYKPDRTAELVEEMLAANSVLAVTTLGYPGTAAVVDRLNEACVPQPFTVTNHPVWADPVSHPWTTGLELSQATEAVLWGAWIEANLPAELPVKVAALVRDDVFGLAYESSFRTWAAVNSDVVSEFVSVPHDTDPGLSVASQMGSIVASEPDVFISMTAGSFCLQVVQEAGRVGLTSSTSLLTSSYCRDPGQFMVPAGDAADNWHIVGGGIKATNDPRFADEPFVTFTNRTLAEAGLEPAVAFYGTGFATYGWALVEVLRIAVELDGGLTRSNLLLAQRAMDLEHPTLLAGVRFAMDGAADSYPVEGSNFGVFDAAAQAWVEDSPVIDVNGSTPNCAWGPDGC